MIYNIKRIITRYNQYAKYNILLFAKKNSNISIQYHDAKIWYIIIINQSI